ncbi:PREDICTED: uncharacterized protein LOC109193513 [Ipomoea nil]|uniref:uncharacterized protein LOC109193513 n=1 Tax=Ipomoea nil TaxID=35883 RepID=UPI000901966A|nr:PREDICTED: uncharacterized protein LOC109193513 [Ipomoea nil]
MCGIALVFLLFEACCLIFPVETRSPIFLPVAIIDARSIRFEAISQPNIAVSLCILAITPPEDLDLASDPFDTAVPAGSFEEMGSEDDIFSTYMDIEKLSAGSGAAADASAAVGSESGDNGVKSSNQLRHRHSNWVDSYLL